MASNLELLQQVALFKGLSGAALQNILSLSKPVKLGKGSFYFQQEDPAARLYVLTKGRVKVFQNTAEGQQVTMRMIHPGEMFGGLAIINPDQGYPGSAISEEDSLALAWDGAIFRALAEKESKLAINIMDLMHSYIEEMQSRFRELATERVEQRAARMLLRLLAQSGRKTDQGVLIDLNLSRQDIAEMTGSTLFTISRILSEWEKRGLIDTGRERVTILKPHELVKIAEGG
jgi:CRP-like cAMP-binding protein